MTTERGFRARFVGDRMEVESCVVDGVTFRPAPEYGAWYELDDPEPSGSVGRLYMPMLAGGLPDVEQLAEISTAWGSA